MTRFRLLLTWLLTLFALLAASAGSEGAGGSGSSRDAADDLKAAPAGQPGVYGSLQFAGRVDVRSLPPASAESGTAHARGARLLDTKKQPTAAAVPMATAVGAGAGPR